MAISKSHAHITTVSQRSRIECGRRRQSAKSATRLNSQTDDTTAKFAGIFWLPCIIAGIASWPTVATSVHANAARRTAVMLNGMAALERACGCSLPASQELQNAYAMTRE